jgi:hypothetical protein
LSGAGDDGQVMILDVGDLSQELTRDTPPMRRVATPARAEPMAQFAPAIQSGESPMRAPKKGPWRAAQKPLMDDREVVTRITKAP